MRAAYFTSSKVNCHASYHEQSVDPYFLGTFAETTSPEHQLHWIYENCKVVQSANGLNTVVESMKIASQKHDLLWYVSARPVDKYFTSPWC